MPLYFAYGANMSLDVMAMRCPSSKPISPARLPRHRFIINSDGYSTVVRDARMEVHGVLWNLAQGDVRTLDRFEDIAAGLYTKVMQPVFVSAGSRRAMLYIGRCSTPGRPVPTYLEGVMAGAAHWQLPEAYQAYLATWLTSRSGVASRPAAAREIGPVPGVTTRAARPTSTIMPRTREKNSVLPDIILPGIGGISLADIANGESANEASANDANAMRERLS